jgi:triphosphatase
MAVETELKLSIAPEHLAKLARHPWLKSLGAERASSQKLYSVYYDTPELELHGRAMALRLRRKGREWLQTLKGGGGVQAGLHQRNEWETPVSGEALDFAALKEIGAPALSAELRGTLQAVFVTDFSRSTRLINFEGAEIELALDSGEVRAGQRTRPISELELELKSGEPRQLFRLALALLDIVPLELEHTSKAEYGYRLFSDTQAEVSKFRLPELQKSQGIAAALQSMIWSCLLHLQANVPGVLQTEDEEYLHQVRVALRRLRVVLTMAERYQPDDELAALHKEVAGLCAVLGLAREWDVFVTQTLAQARTHLAEHEGIKEVLAISQQLREKQQGNLRQTLHSRDYQRLLLRLGYWMQGEYWSKPSTEIPLFDFAGRVLEQRSRQVSERAKKLSAADAGQLHALRIACKKLRYSTELFAPILGAGQIRRYLSALSSLQDILGALNDIACARHLLDELDTPLRRETLAAIRSQLTREERLRLIELNLEWNNFSKLDFM